MEVFRGLLMGRTAAFFAISRHAEQNTLHSSDKYQAQCVTVGDPRYGSDRFGRAASHPYRIASFRTCQTVTNSLRIVEREGGLKPG